MLVVQRLRQRPIVLLSHQFIPIQPPPSSSRQGLFSFMLRPVQAQTPAPATEQFRQRQERRITIDLHLLIVRRAILTA